MALGAGYFLGDRSLSPFDGFVLGDLSGAVAVHDRYRNYDAYGAVAHQLCCAHLLRDLADAAEQYPDAIWPGRRRSRSPDPASRESRNATSNNTAEAA